MDFETRKHMLHRGYAWLNRKLIVIPLCLIMSIGGISVTINELTKDVREVPPALAIFIGLIPLTFSLYILWLLYSETIKYVVGVKKGKRVMGKSFFTIKHFRNNTTNRRSMLCVEMKYVDETGKEIEHMFRVASREFDRYKDYTNIPMFVYKNRLYPDFINIEEFGNYNEESLSEEKAVSEAKKYIEKQDSKYSLSHVEDILGRYQMYMMSCSCIAIFGIFIGTLVFLNARHLEGKGPIDISTHGYVTAIGFFLIAIVAIIGFILLKRKSSAYKNLSSKGVKVQAACELFRSNREYKSKKGNFVKSMEFNLNKEQMVAVFSYDYMGKNLTAICTLHKSMYEILKDEKTLPAYIYKNKLYPDLKRIYALFKKKVNGF